MASARGSEHDETAARSARAELVARHRAARAAYNKALDEHGARLGFPAEIGIDESHSAYLDTLAYRRAHAARAEMTAIEQDYFGALPRLAMGPCPHCDKPLLRSFDPFGLDGPWWRSDAQPDEPPACPHFCFLHGAVDLGGHPPSPDFDVHPGPGAPFVIPRVLQSEGMIAVLSEIRMDGGARAYPIAYFAARRPPVQTLAASWARTNFVYSTQLGVHAWRRADEPAGNAAGDVRDFALGFWLAREKVRWCDAGSDRTALSTAAASDCPFASLSGVREPQVIFAADPSID